MAKKLVIFGSSEIATLAKYYFEHDSEYDVVAFTVDDDFIQGTEELDIPLIPFSQVNNLYPPDEHEMFVGLSYSGLNQLREKKYHQAKAAGYILASYVCSKSVFWQDLDIGDNCFILENQTIQPTVKIGNNVMIWSGNHIGHGSIIGDHTYVSSHVVISGHCRIGQRCFVGVNSTLRDFLEVEDDCFIAMQAAVVRNMAFGSVCIGQSGDIYLADDRRAKAIKQNFFRNIVL
jgi:sugar O-acyltransferase (sialic acid O-acetyltransferase NeuD family)